ncbi:MAG TPA: hypothetical protein VMU36_00505 [Spirochaetia bacterium]|nr:hypothetical protein [Spirochaetia bacterium]
MKSRKSPVIDLPLKITLTTAGVEWFIRNRRQLKQLRMADSRLEYGLSVAEVSATSLQRMINIDYIASVEVARSEFSSKRREIIDLTKLIVHRILFKKFENETSRMFLSSALVKRWNRQNPGRCIDESTSYSPARVDSLFAAVASEIPLVSSDIQEPLLRGYAANPAINEEERTLRAFLSDGFVLNASKLLWCILARSRGQPEYDGLVGELRQILSSYIEKGAISENLALMVVELLGFVEVSHYRQVTEKLLKGRRKAGEALVTDERMRREVRRRMEAEGDLLSLTYQLGSKGAASIGTEHRLRISICNQEKGFRRLNEQLETRLGFDVKEHSLMEFYRKIPEQQINTDLGLYYLSYLQKACEKQDIRIESTVSLIPRSDLTVIHLTLGF